MWISEITSHDKYFSDSEDIDFDDSLPLLLPKRDNWSNNFRPRHTAQFAHSFQTPTRHKTTSFAKQYSKGSRSFSEKSLEYLHRFLTGLSSFCGRKTEERIDATSDEISESSCSSRFRVVIPYVYMVVIALVVLVSSVLSFMRMPEYHTTSLSCSHLNPSSTKITHSRYFSNSFHHSGRSHNPMKGMSSKEYEHLFVNSPNTGK